MDGGREEKNRVEDRQREREREREGEGERHREEKQTSHHPSLRRCSAPLKGRRSVLRPMSTEVRDGLHRAERGEEGMRGGEENPEKIYLSRGGKGRRFRILDHRHGDQSPGNRLTMAAVALATAWSPSDAQGEADEEEAREGGGVRGKQME